MSKTLFQNLVQWSSTHYSTLPWRNERSLYRTLVSEIMLQQTTVGTVLNHYERFLKIYPTIDKLAASSEEEICIAWKGLGYYRRAKNLRNLAIQIKEKHKGKIPTTLEELMLLKGIGPYTANAIVAIGADKSGLAVDANLERVLSRFYGYKEHKGPKLQKKLWEGFAEKSVLPEMKQLSPRALNEALMDLGRIVCQSRKASCSLCPLASACVANKSNSALSFPVESEKQKKDKEKEDLFIKLLRIVVQDKKKILFYQKAENEWLSGQWELPTFILETNDEKLKQYPRLKTKKSFKESQVIKGAITKYSIENHVIKMSMDEFEKLAGKSNCSYQFKTFNEQLNLSTTSIKALKKSL
jgi:A/G-specific adenine glycosylase